MSRSPHLSGANALLLAGCAVMASWPAAASANDMAATEVATTVVKSATTTNSNGFRAKISAPADFADLEGPRELVMDLYFGGRRLGDAQVVSDRGQIRFRDPAAAAALLTMMRSPAVAAELLSAPLDANADRVCARLNDTDCGRIDTDSIALIADEDHLRLDLFFGPTLLKANAEGPTGFLPVPSAGPSLASSFGVALSGNSAEKPLYNLQTRNVLALGAARLRSNVAYATGFGVLVDDFVAELDRPDQRWSAGLFWAPGNDFTGERRILGVGFQTQLDTRVDKERLQGTPQYLFLRQPARVELLVDGRLVDSRYYEAGNNLLDTSVLPGGSTNLILRIQEGGGPVREERRFFVRSADMAPLGRPLFHAMVGALANSRKDRPVSLSRQLFFSAGANLRLSEAIGIEADVTGTQDKQLGQAGLFLVTRPARIRAAALLSGRGDRGALLQISSNGSSRLQYSFDLRRVSSRSGQALLPETATGESFGGSGFGSLRPMTGSYTQMTGNVGLQLGPVDLQLIGYYRGEGRRGRDYSIGPSVAWRVVQQSSLQLTFLADAQHAAGGTATFVGARLVMNRGGFSAISSGGTQTGRGRSARIGSTSAQWDVQPWADSHLSLNAGATRELSSTALTGSATFQSRFGTARGDVNRRVGGPTGYALNIQSGGAVSRDGLALGGRNLAESALIASVRGRAGAFDLLIDGVVRGRVSSGGSLPLFLAPYRSYQVQLRPVDGGAIDFDASPRTVTLYPGNVAHEQWDATALLTVFGQLVDRNGRPLVGARLEGDGPESASGTGGWFQLERAPTRSLTFVRADGGRCTLPLPAAKNRDYLSLGTVTCS